jgi:predicted transcriptional regulator
MSHVLPISDDTYRRIASLAQQQGTTPEALAEELLRERLAERAAMQRQNAEWAAGLDDALARAARGANVRYDSTEAFFAALDQIPLIPPEPPPHAHHGRGR